MAFYSSQPRFTGGVLIGPMDAGSNIQMIARFGSNGLSGDAPPEVALEFNDQLVRSERVTWDPIHADRARTLFLGIFQVRFEVDEGVCRASAGTNPFLDANPEPFNLINRLQIGASVPRTLAHREVEWNWADVTFRYVDNTCETYSMSALPRALSPQRLRRSVQAPDDGGGSTFEQFSELAAPGGDLVAVRVVGLVTFRANDPVYGTDIIGPDDLQAKIAVFTDANLPPEQLEQARRNVDQGYPRSKVHPKSGKR